MKEFVVDFTFPEVSSGKMYQSSRQKATGMTTAVARAYKEVKQRPGIKGKRIHSVKISVVEIQALREAKHDSEGGDLRG
jgi:hypothetical protein